MSQHEDHGEENLHTDSGSSETDEREAMLDELERQMFERARMSCLKR